ncbi:MAG: response regulator [Candidatus Omnitrophica bacterium]|nr:response regulator [Candidatus Omnitrophota bacterium]
MPKRILVVDDEPDVLKVAIVRLKMAGYEVFTAINGQQALDFVRQTAPDMMFLDLRLPIIDGYNVCQQIKSDEKLKNIKVVIFTASVDQLDEKIKQVKADDYLLKPFDSAGLVNKAKKFLS